MQLARIESRSTMAASLEEVRANIADNRRRGLLELHQHADWMSDKGDEPIALIGGGPSLKDTLTRAKGYRATMVCGSAHDYVVGQGLAPTFAAVLDPDSAIMAQYLSKPSPDTTYLVASICAPSVFDALAGRSIYLWHSAGTAPEDIPMHVQVGGGCTIGLRAIALAVLLGFRQVHFFGFDSCYGPSGASHAYDAEQVDAPIRTKVGDIGRWFDCAGYHLAQAQQFQQILLANGHMFEPTFFGDGLLTEIMRVGAEKARQTENA